MNEQTHFPGLLHEDEDADYLANGNQGVEIQALVGVLFLSFQSILKLRSNITYTLRPEKFSKVSGLYNFGSLQILHHPCGREEERKMIHLSC